jgi:hypothetical protein
MAKRKGPKQLPVRADLPKLTKKECDDAAHLGAIAKFARKELTTPDFCINCGQEVTGKTAMASAASETKFCPTHGVKLRPDGTCPMED